MNDVPVEWIEEAERYMIASARAVATEGWLTAEERYARLDHFRRMMERAGPRFVLESGAEAKEAYRVLYVAARREFGDDLEVPEGLEPGDVAAASVEVTQRERTRLYIWQSGSELLLRGHTAPGSLRVGLPLGWIDVGERQVKIVPQTGRPLDVLIESDRLLVRPIPSGPQFEIRSDVESRSFRRWQRAWWMSSSGRDEYGLWCEVSVSGVTWRLRWVPPGRYLQGSPPSEAGRLDREGPQRDVEVP